MTVNDFRGEEHAGPTCQASSTQSMSDGEDVMEYSGRNCPGFDVDTRPVGSIRARDKVSNATARGSGLSGLLNRSVFSTVLLLTLAAMPGAVSAGLLDEHLWRHRLIVLVAPTSNDASVAQQRRLIEQRADALIDRDIQVYELFERGVSTLQGNPLADGQAAMLRAELGEGPDARLLILIGKDGSVKRREALPADLREKFLLIDEMPMRRAEIREKTERGQPVTRP